MKNVLLFSIIFLSVNLYSQCNGCNKNNQKLDIWDIQYTCNQKLISYDECNNITNVLTESISIAKTGEELLNVGLQKWNNNDLTFFALFDNRYKLNLEQFTKFKNLNHLLLKGIEIIDNNFKKKIILKGEYILLIRNQLSIPLSQLEFSNNLKYISLDENHLTGEITEQFFNNPELKEVLALHLSFFKILFLLRAYLKSCPGLSLTYFIFTFFPIFIDFFLAILRSLLAISIFLKF